MITPNEVALFLLAFHGKMKTWQILYRDDRQKNTQTLLALEINSRQRTAIIESLKVTDYSQGPRPDQLSDGPPLWVFGKELKGRMIYIKITMGREESPVICISFHEAEFPIKFPYKNI
jgi:hypothetical protein